MVRSKATVQRNLRIAKPFWETTPSISVRTFRQPKRQNYDVIIVGAGISGAMLAEALADGIRTIAIVERRSPVSGSSMASTAMIQHEIDVPFSYSVAVWKNRWRNVFGYVPVVLLSISPDW